MLNIPPSTRAVPARWGRRLPEMSKRVSPRPGSRSISCRSWTPYDEDAGSHEDEQHAGHGEEPGQVDRRSRRGRAGSPAPRRPRCRRRQPAAAWPWSAKPSGWSRPVAVRVNVQSRTPVSSPSRPTARNAIRVSDHRRPAAASIRPRSSPAMLRAARAIQKTIQVTNAAATRERMPPISSCERKSSCCDWSPRPRVTATLSSHREPDAQPHEPQQVAPVRLDQVGDQDADDERRLQSLTKADQKVGEHRASLQIRLALPKVVRSGVHGRMPIRPVRLPSQHGDHSPHPPGTALLALGALVLVLCALVAATFDGPRWTDLQRGDDQPAVAERDQPADEPDDAAAEELAGAPGRRRAVAPVGAARWTCCSCCRPPWCSASRCSCSPGFGWYDGASGSAAASAPAPRSSDARAAARRGHRHRPAGGARRELAHDRRGHPPQRDRGDVGPARAGRGERAVPAPARGDTERARGAGAGGVPARRRGDPPAGRALPRGPLLGPPGHRGRTGSRRPTASAGCSRRWIGMRAR